MGRIRNELLRALSEKKTESGICQQALARKLDIERALVNRQLSGEENLSLRSLADLAWAMDMEISFELKSPANAGQNQPIMTSTVSHGEIKYIDGRAKEALGSAATASSGLVMAKTA